MKFAKSILLASATAFVSFAATAADLPKKSAPAPVCGFGAGFMMLPGTDTCLKIGGSVQHFSYFNANVSNYLSQGTGYATRARFQLNADARTNTSMGVLRSFVELRMLRGPGTVALGGLPNSGANYAGPVSTVSTINAAFIQFAGFTAGYAANPFNFNAGYQANAIGNYIAPTAGNANQLAYTASMGSGLTATLAIVDSQYTRIGGGANTLANIGLGPVAPAAGGAMIYAGNQVADVVANVNLTQAWGQLQAQAAFHRVSTAVGDANGAAFGAGAIVNLPMLGAGDTLYVNATWARGATAYLRDDGNNDNIYAHRTGNSLGFADAHYNAALNGGTLTTGWSVYGGARHFWSSTVYTSLYAGYAKYENATGGAGGVAASARRWNVGANVAWLPVRNFDLQLETTLISDQATVGGVTGVEAKALYTGLRVNRAF